MQTQTVSEEETRQLGIALGKCLCQLDINSAVIIIKGKLGAGKTTITQGISKGMKVFETVESPTFVFLTIHRGDKTLYHFDLYRINNIEELDELGFIEALDRPGIIVIEWGEKIENLVDADMEISIEKTGENDRMITLVFHTKELEVLHECIMR